MPASKLAIRGGSRRGQWIFTTVLKRGANVARTSQPGHPPGLALASERAFPMHHQGLD